MPCTSALAPGARGPNLAGGAGGQPAGRRMAAVPDMDVALQLVTVSFTLRCEPKVAGPVKFQVTTGRSGPAVRTTVEHSASGSGKT